METILFFAPLFGALIAGLCWRLIGETAAILTALATTAVAAVMSFALLLDFDGNPYSVELGRGLLSGSIEAPWLLVVDSLSLSMVSFALSMATLAQLYALGFTAPARHFKDGEAYQPRIVALIGFLAFALMLFAFAGNFMQLLAGWELSLIAGYLLTVAYFRKPTACLGGLRLLVFGRLASLSLLLAAGVLFLSSDSFAIEEALALTEAGADLDLVARLLGLAIALMLGQLFAHLWLADVSEAPIPGSLTILTAGLTLTGVYFAARFAPLLEMSPSVLLALAIGAVVTAIYSASIALAQTDMRRLLALLAAVQISFTLAAIGLDMPGVALAYAIAASAGLACLFLGVGAVMEAQGAAPDLRQLGGLRATHPIPFAVMLIGALGLSGIGLPVAGAGLFGLGQAAGSGALMSAAWTEAPLLFAGLLIALTLSALAAWRLVFALFFGRSKTAEDTPRPVPWSMQIPMIVAALSVPALGLAAPFIETALGGALGMDQAPSEFGAAVYGAPLAGVIGLAVAWFVYIAKPGTSRQLRDAQTGLHGFLQSGWRLDEALMTAIALPLSALSKLLWRGLDRNVIDGGTRWLAQSMVPRMGRGLVRSQASPVYSYIFAIAIGVVLIAALISFRLLN